ncbi:hypothetical protein RE428_36050 [Marinobacter nanhaiticus D15-8W]|nr:hypothetical protein RE428_36050 [Marinobacter nanhaiticus D15-8W]
MQLLKPIIRELIDRIDDFGLVRESRKRRSDETVAVTIEELRLSIKRQPSNSVDQASGRHEPE